MPGPGGGYVGAVDIGSCSFGGCGLRPKIATPKGRRVIRTWRPFLITKAESGKFPTSRGSRARRASKGWIPTLLARRARRTASRRPERSRMVAGLFGKPSGTASPVSRVAGHDLPQHPTANRTGERGEVAGHAIARECGQDRCGGGLSGHRGKARFIGASNRRAFELLSEQLPQESVANPTSRHENARLASRQPAPPPSESARPRCSRESCS